MSAVAKYLERYAEREAALGEQVPECDAVLVVPARRERVQLLDGYREAARAFGGRVLVVLVVNGEPGEARGENAALLRSARGACRDVRELRVPGGRGARAEVRAVLGDTSDFALLVVDRASPGAELPPKQGVGLARRIGADVALAAHVCGRIRGEHVAFTDADATLPVAFFDELARAAEEPVARVHPYRHVLPAGVEGEAGAHYELWLRYTVLGLHRAGSPYAVHTIGSTIAVRFDAYASVRGVPRRAAGEDFYLLDKLLKLGDVERTRSEPILLEARSSDRTPFGTGDGTRRLCEQLRAGHEPRLIDWSVFERLGRWLRALDALAEHRSLEAWRSDVTDLLMVGGAASSVEATERALSEALAGVTPGDPVVLRRRLHGWFDGLRTVRAMHALRDVGPPPLPWRQALAKAGLPDGGGVVRRAARELAAREGQLPERVGVARRALEPPDWS